MRTAGSGFSYDGHPFRWYDALLFIVCMALWPVTLLVMFVVDFEILQRTVRGVGQIYNLVRKRVGPGTWAALLNS